MSSVIGGWIPRYPVTLAITGASGAPYAIRLLQMLVLQRVPTWLVISRHGWRLLQTESGLEDLDALRARIDAGGASGSFADVVTVFDDEDRGATPASGSARSSGMVVCPCSMGTVSSIACGSSRSLVERAADVTLKERRKLILVPRETPLSLIHLENLATVTRAGATVIPAAPGFYHQPAGISDLVDFIVARILDHLDIEHTIGRRWGDEVANGEHPE